MKGQGYSGDGGGGKSCWLRTIEFAFVHDGDGCQGCETELQCRGSNEASSYIYVACFIYSVHFAGQ